ncbi:O-antigen ligase family protein [Myroides sp. 1354]|uniref:O-antigen ligase family protein n=1 Tax=unclassified Myroides TaxID=2642485 RepID=UPI002576954F|nr:MULTISPECIES: O-antigen ligase family protein [unclassified Myroides]MDM1043717.1 O-antigen ligase family protein [Myroides sp. R163-1]MDM1054233.1 O-antigen ligase family protein [Myroides sp. 1354]MDM1067529.1 O-antigen ligase family protein [Myroides sp. 1372]
MKIKIQDIDVIIWALLLPILIIDSVNGLLYENNISTPFSISQIYKLGIVGLFVLRLVKTPKYLLMVFALFGYMIFPSCVQWLKGMIDWKVIIQDLIFAFKYLIIVIAFFYFQVVFSTVNRYEIPKYFVWIKLSYWILAFNLSLKLVGLAYPMYTNGNIGSRGWFIAGNEISALLIILSCILAYYYWVINKNWKFFVLYGLVSFLLGLLISSKTGLLGIVLVHILIIGSTTAFDIRNKKTRNRLLYGGGIALLFCGGITVFIQQSAIMNRYLYFWHKMDFVTFILSSRNIFLAEMIPIFEASYTTFEQWIGVGNYRFEELANQKIEIDILDILFTYGYVGVFIFCGLLVVYSLNIVKLMKNCTVFAYAKLSFICCLILVVLSCLSGHIFNSGIAGIFIGFVLSLAYYKKSNG